MFKKLNTYTLILLILTIFVSCDFKNSKQSGTDTHEGMVTSREFETESGKKFVVEIDNRQSASLSKVKVTTLEFNAVNTVHAIGAMDKVESVFLADLDENGFEEIYIVSRSAGSGSYAQIYGVASNKDKSTSPIYVPEISEKEREQGGLFYGFMGHNSFKIEEGKLLNTFPVYTKTDSNAKPTGGKQTVEYELIPGEASWILAPKKIVFN